MAERSEDMITFLFWFFVFVVAFAISAVIASVNAEHARKVEEENRRQHEKKIRHVDNYNLKLELEKWKMRNHR